MFYKVGRGVVTELTDKYCMEKVRGTYVDYGCLISADACFFYYLVTVLCSLTIGYKVTAKNFIPSS